MHLNKRNGVIMLEVLLILNLLLIIIMYSSKIVAINYRKLEVSDIKEDVKTISEEENELLKEVLIEIMGNDEIKEKFYKCKEDKNINYERVYSKNNDIKLLIKNSKIYIEKQTNRINPIIRIVDMKIIDEEDDTKIVFIPTTYKIYTKIR